jgi:hypothetical protein
MLSTCDVKHWSILNDIKTIYEGWQDGSNTTYNAFLASETLSSDLSTSKRKACQKGYLWAKTNPSHSNFQINKHTMIYKYSAHAFRIIQRTQKD